MASIAKTHIRSSSLSSATWIYIAFALVLGFIVPSIEKLLPPTWVSPMEKSTIQSILGAIAAGMITLTGLVFSLFFVLVQFGSATYSPRIVTIFANSYTLRHSLGIFTGTFLFALMALRNIGISKSPNVSDLPVWISFIWLLASIVVLARLIRVFASMTITNMLPALGRIGQSSISRNYGVYSTDKKTATTENLLSTREHQGFSTKQIIYNGEPGYITKINSSLLLSFALQSDSVISIPYTIGDAVKVGFPLALISTKMSAIEESSLSNSIELGHERALLSDPKYPFRLLVDLGIRALSPGINDPTTAVQALDQIEPLLQRIGNSNLDVGEIRDQQGVIRLIFKTPSWDDYLQLGLGEILHYGANSIQVERRLQALLIHLQQSVPPDRAEIVRQFLEQRHSVAAASFSNATFRRWADTADREGIGSGIDS